MKTEDLRAPYNFGKSAVSLKILCFLLAGASTAFGQKPETVINTLTNESSRSASEIAAINYETARQKVVKNPFDAEARCILSTELLKFSQFDSALKQAEAATSIKKTDFCLESRVHALFALGKFPAVLDLTRYPGPTMPRSTQILRARSFEATGDFRRAALRYEQVILTAEDEHTLTSLAEAARLLIKHPEIWAEAKTKAFRYYERAFRLSKDSRARDLGRAWVAALVNDGNPVTVAAANASAAVDQLMLPENASVDDIILAGRFAGLVRDSQRLQKSIELLKAKHSRDLRAVLIEIRYLSFLGLTEEAEAKLKLAKSDWGNHSDIVATKARLVPVSGAPSEPYKIEELFLFQNEKSSAAETGGKLVSKVGPAISGPVFAKEVAAKIPRKNELQLSWAPGYSNYALAGDGLSFDFRSQNVSRAALEFQSTQLNSPSGIILKLSQDQVEHSNITGFTPSTVQLVRRRGEIAYQGILDNAGPDRFCFWRAGLSHETRDAGPQSPQTMILNAEISQVNFGIGRRWSNFELSYWETLLEIGSVVSFREFRARTGNFRYGGSLGWKIAWNRYLTDTWKLTLGFTGEVRHLQFEGTGTRSVTDARDTETVLLVPLGLSWRN